MTMPTPASTRYDRLRWSNGPPAIARKHNPIATASKPILSILVVLNHLLGKSDTVDCVSLRQRGWSRSPQEEETTQCFLLAVIYFGSNGRRASIDLGEIEVLE